MICSLRPKREFDAALHVINIETNNIITNKVIEVDWPSV